MTGYHRFYDQTTGWIQTKDMYVGETLRGDHGDVTVAELIPSPGLFRVYNMTVEADHVYYVGDLTALTHNTYKGNNADDARNQFESLSRSAKKYLKNLRKFKNGEEVEGSVKAIIDSTKKSDKRWINEIIDEWVG